MLHIIYNYKQLFNSFLLINLNWNEWLSSGLDILDHNDFEKSPKIEKSVKDFILNFDINKDKNNKSKVESLQISLDDLWFKRIDWKKIWIDWYFWKNTKFAYEKALLSIDKQEKEKQIIDESKDNQSTLKVKVKVLPNTNTSNDNQKNIDSNEKNLSDIKALFDKIWLDYINFSVVNINSLYQTLSKPNFLENYKNNIVKKWFKETKDENWDINTFMTWEKIWYNHRDNSIYSTSWEQQGLDSIIRQLEKKDKNHKVVLEDIKTKNIDEEISEIDKYTFDKTIMSLAKDFVEGKDINLEYTVRKNVGSNYYTIPNWFDEKYDDFKKTYYYEIDKTATIKWWDRQDLLKKIEDSDIRNALFKKYQYEDNRSTFTQLSQWFIKLITFNFKDQLEHSIKSLLENIEAVDINNPESVKNYLFDFNSNWVIETKLRDNLSEIALYDYIRSVKEIHSIEDIKNIFTNLWFSDDLNQIKTDISFKIQFSKRLNTVIKMKVPLTVLTIKDWYKTFIEKRIDRENEIKEDVKKQVDAHFDENKEEIKEQIKEKLKEEWIDRDITDADLQVVKKFTVWFMQWYKKWIWVNFKIAEMCDWVVANLAFWVDSKWNLAVGPNISFNQKLFNLINVSAWATIWWVWIDWTVDWDLANKISPDAINISILAWLWMAFSGSTYPIYHIWLTEKATSNVEWHNRIMEIASKTYPKFLEKIKNNEDFTDEEIKELMWSFPISDEQINTFRADFEELKDNYNSLVLNISEDKKQIVETKLKESILINLSNSIYRESTWLEITWLWAFIIPWVISWALVLWEYNWIEHEVIKDNISDKISFKMNKKPLIIFLEEKKFLLDSQIIQFNWTELIIDKSQIEVLSADWSLNFPDEVKSVDLGNGFSRIEIKDWYNLNVLLKEKYSYDKNIDKTFKKYTLYVEPVKNNFEQIEEQKPNNEFEQSVMNLDNVITKNTRANKFADTIMDPNLDFDTRWRWFESFSKRSWRYSAELTKTIKAFSEIYNSKTEFTIKEKMYIISTVTQMMKKSNDMNSWNLEAYNDKSRLDKMIDIDKKRRKWFNELLWFNTDKLAKQYYSKLEQNAWKIWEINWNWFSFDASASRNVWLKNKTLKWMDVFYSNLQMLSIWDEPIMIEVTEQSDINWFVSTLEKTTMVNWAKEQLLQDIKDWKVKLYFYKDPDWFDDRIIPVSTWKINAIAWSVSDRIVQKNESIWLVWVWTWNERPKTPPTNPILWAWAWWSNAWWWSSWWTWTPVWWGPVF